MCVCVCVCVCVYVCVGNSMPSVCNFLHVGLKFLPNLFYGWGGGGGGGGYETLLNTKGHHLEVCCHGDII